MNNRVELTLIGPEFIQAAVEISKKASFGTISKLYVYNLTTDAFSALQNALTKLRNYFTKDCVVIILTPQNLPTNAASVLRVAAGVPVNISAPTFQGWGAIKPNKAAMAQNQQQAMAQNRQQTQTIQTQIKADAQKQRVQSWHIISETQKSISEMIQDIAVNKARTVQKMHGKMSTYLRS